MRRRVRLATYTLLVSVLHPLPIRAEEPPNTAVYRARSDRVALKFAFYSPTGRVGSVDLSEVNRWVEEALERNTDLDVVPLADNAVDQCVESAGKRRRLTCLVEESSEEWMRMRNSLATSYFEVKDELRASRSHPRYVLVFSAAAAFGGDRLAALLIDVEDALERVHRVRSRSPQPTAEALAEVEDEISRFSVVARPPILERIISGDEVRRYVETLVEEHLREAFTRAEHWRPFGQIEVSVDAADPFAVELDGVSLGTTVEGKAKLLDVTPGERRISLKNEDFEELAAKVVVETGKVAKLRVTPIRKQSKLVYGLRQAVFWGGVASTAAGISVLIFGAVERSGEDRRDVCIGGEGCASGPYLRFGDGPMEQTKSSNGSGAPIAPLGYSLLGLGAAWMLGPLLDDGEERIPWIEAVVGIAVFGAAFGISLALDPSDPVCQAHQSC